MSKDSDEFIDGVIRDIAELPDRTSPPEAPEMMLVSADELREILIRNFMALGLKLAGVDQLHRA